MYAERHIGKGERGSARRWCTGTGAQAQGSLFAKRLAPLAKLGRAQHRGA
jgi:hypothetical protein